MKSHLTITLFDEFSIENGENIVTDQMNRSKKIWVLLGYLIQHRDRAITCSELIDLLWAEKESKNPANSLKVLVHRARLILENLHIEENIPLILYYQDRYGWNPEISCTVDTELFEDACHKAEAEPNPEARLVHLMKAILVYKGEFLKKSIGETWIMHTANYYSTKFLKITAEAAEILFQLKRYDELINICKKAITYAPYDESFYIYLLKALVSTNQPQKALEQYQHVSELFFREFGISPSEELTSIYKEVIKTQCAPEMNLEIIKEKLQEGAAEGALFCEYEFFKTLYHVKARSASRSGESAYIALLSILNPTGNGLPNQKTINLVMDTLNHTIRHTLRRGDIFTRYSVNQFLIMLPGTTYETSNLVLQRILKTYRKEFPGAAAIFRHSTLPVTPNELRP